MSTIVLRNTKGSELTYVELDANFTNLNTDKVEKPTDDTTTNSTFYPLFSSGTTSNATKVSTTKLSYNPSTGGLSSTLFTGGFHTSTTYTGSFDSAGGSTINLALTNFFIRTVSSTTTYGLTNIPTSKLTSFTLQITNGGSSTVNWWSGIKWAGGAIPLLTSSGTDVLSFYSYDSGNTWIGLLVAKDVR